MNNKLLSNLFNAFLAQGLSFLLSVFIALVLPKILGPESYSYWQLFVFYTGYAGLFLFGLNDGLYLVFGGERRDVIDKNIVTGQFKTATLMQVILAAVLVATSVSIDIEVNRKIVLILSAVYFPLFNLTGYWGSIFRTVNETQLYSRSIIVPKVANAIGLV